MIYYTHVYLDVLCVDILQRTLVTPRNNNNKYHVNHLPTITYLLFFRGTLRNGKCFRICAMKFNFSPKICCAMCNFFCTSENITVLAIERRNIF